MSGVTCLHKDLQCQQFSSGCKRCDIKYSDKIKEKNTYRITYWYLKEGVENKSKTSKEINWMEKGKKENVKKS